MEALFNSVTSSQRQYITQQQSSSLYNRTDSYIYHGTMETTCCFITCVRGANHQLTYHFHPAHVLTPGQVFHQLLHSNREQTCLQITDTPGAERQVQMGAHRHDRYDR